MPRSKGPYTAHRINGKITINQYQMVHCIATGMTVHQTADHLGLTYKTVQNTLTSVRRNFSSDTTMGVAIQLLKLGLMKLDDL